jgi:hypothetical protein
MSLFTVLASSKIAASAAAVGALTVAGVGSAAYTGSLPTPAQQVAHNVLGAPAPALDEAKGAATAAKSAVTDEASKATATATQAADKATGAAKSAVADAQGAAADAAAKAASTKAGASASVDAAGIDLPGLCTARANGGLDAASSAYKSLTLAAKGEANVNVFCADVLKASATGSAGANGTAAAPAAPAVPAVPTLPAAPALPSAPALSDVANAPSAPALPSDAASALTR